jgi:hypothetical protein
MFLGNKVRLVRRAYTIAAICGILNISQPYSPPRPVTRIALTFSFVSISLTASVV